MVAIRRRNVVLAAGLAMAIAAAGTIIMVREHEAEGESLHEFAKEHRALVNAHARPVAIMMEKLENGGEAISGPAQESYENRAYPAPHVAAVQVASVYQNFLSVSKRPGGKKTNWQVVGPTTPVVSGPATYTGRPTVVSGRVTALAVAPGCHSRDCKLFVGEAGGGVWEADNALTQANWQPASNGIPSLAIGSLAFDPNDQKGRTLYAGTGEPNGSSDSEAGVGLYKSTDFGKNWTLVPGSYAVSVDRSIASIAIDPTNPNHLLIGTAVARHGSSSVNGGRFTPPNAPKVGLYESTDGGQSFALAYSKPSDPVDPASVNGSDFFRGGVTNVQFDKATGDLYFSISDYGLFRRQAATVTQIFASLAAGSVGASSVARTEFAFAPLANGNLRIYLGDALGTTGPSALFRTDDARAAGVVWTKLAAADSYCGGQCSYDMPVASPAGKPDTVWVGGQMQYNEIFTPNPPSNGRAVMRSIDGGLTFTDMTNDTQSPPLGMHPDQHAIAFVPDNPDIAFLGSDGGVVRTSGSFADASSQCDTRGLTASQLPKCKGWLAAIPTTITLLNDGLNTLQFQSVAVSALDPTNDLLAGTQDNGTWAYDGKGAGSWFESVGGDGGQAVIDAVDSTIRMHSYFSAQHDVNFNGNDPLGWDWVSDPLLASGEASSFYVPLLGDPVTGGTVFNGLQHVWRTTDSGGPRAYLDQHCNEFFGDFTVQCGDWVPLGPSLTSSAFGSKSGQYVVALARANDPKTLWAATRRGRVFVSSNANGAPASVAFDRIDTSAQPTRFVSGISVDSTNPNHAIVSYSGYDAYSTAAGTATGHVFDVVYNPATHAATWTSLDANLGDLPVTGIAYDATAGDVYASFDWGVVVLKKGSASWQPAAGSLPPVAVYGLTIDVKARVLYAATHGRGIYRLNLG